MCDLYEKLRILPYFSDNDYLQKYCIIIERHFGSRRRNKGTNEHHILPRCWFRLNSLEVDNSLRNLVTLPYREHILAHYYLCLCTLGPLKYANELAFVNMISRKKLSQTDRQLLRNLSEYDKIREDFSKKQKSNYKIYS